MTTVPAATRGTALAADADGLVAWGRRPQAAVLVAQLSDPGRGWDAVVAGEYERAFYGSQYASMAPLSGHYGVQLWMPEAGGRAGYASGHDEQAMTMPGLSPEREDPDQHPGPDRDAAQVREQGRYLGGRPPNGYRPGDAGPHPNKAHAAWGRRAHRLEPDPETAHVVQWISAHPALVSEDDFAAVQDVSAARGPAPRGDAGIPERRRYLLAGLLACGWCGRRVESAWSNGRPAYRCRYGHTSASAPDPERRKTTYVREDRILPHLPALHLLLAEPPETREGGGAPAAEPTSGTRPPRT